MAVRVLQGNEYKSNYSQATQVYKATHDGAGKRLPFRYRSYISFSFGGKLIEDFGLIAIAENDKLERSAYSKFDDIIETHETYDGQIYWGTHLTNNELKLTLATDGITSRQLDEFRQWFAPGKNRELILMEHPNRAIMARVSEPPQISVLPFSTEGDIKVLSTKYTTEVSLLKGTITLSFIMDEPYWYAKHNIIYPFIKAGGANGIINIKDDPYRIKDLLMNGSNKNFFIEYQKNNTIISTTFVPTFFNITNKGYWDITCKFDNGTSLTLNYPEQIVGLYNGVITLPDLSTGIKDTVNNDALDYAKIIYEDNIPHLAMIKTSVLLGENIGGVANDIESRVYNDDEEGRTINGLEAFTGAHVTYYAYVAYDNEMVSWSENATMDSSHPMYLFYSGTAPSKPVLQFNFSPTFNSNGYVNLPKNLYSHPNEIKEKKYNYIAFDDNKFYFSVPSLINGYNQAINIVKNFKTGQALNDLLDLLKENINEYYARAWAIFCAKSLANNTTYVTPLSAITASFSAQFIARMKYLICDNNSTITPIKCTFNSKEGTAIVVYSYIREASGSFSSVTDISTLIDNSTLKLDCVQNAGDMVKSDYLIIDGRNYPSYEGYIDKEECHILTTDFSQSNPLTELLVTFQNMYY